MEKRTPGAGKTTREGEAIGKPDCSNLVVLSQNFNLPDLERRELFSNLGQDLPCRGWRATAEFIAELADLPPEIADEIQLRLETYCRIAAETYLALGCGYEFDEVSENDDHDVKSRAGRASCQAEGKLR